MKFYEDKVYSALRWNGFTVLARFVLNLAQAIILANILGPNEFAIVSILLIIVMVFVPLLGFGTTTSIIHFQNLTDTEKSNLFWFNLFSAIGLSALLFCIHPLIDYFFKSTNIPISSIFFIALFLLTFSIGQYYLSFLEKKLLFNKVAVIELLSTFLGFLVIVIYLIAYKKSATAFAFGLFFRSFFRTFFFILLQKSNPIRLTKPHNLSSLKRFLVYGKNNTFYNILNSFVSNLDLLFGGRFLTAVDFSLYSLPRDVGMKISNRIINPIINKVSLPLIARDQNNLKEAKEHYLFTIFLTCSLSYPAYGVIIVTAPFLVSTFLNESWSNTTIFLQLLCVWGLIRTVFNCVETLVLALGQPQLLSKFFLASLVPAFLFFLLLINFDIYGLILGNIVFALFQVIFSWKFVVSQLINVKFVELLQAIYKPLICSLLVLLTSFYLQNIVSFNSSLVNLVFYMVVFLLLYLTFSFFLNKRLISTLVSLIKA